MEQWLETAARWLLGPEPAGTQRPMHLWPRWIFLRALGLIYFSAFYSLVFQIKGLIGPGGILPADDYLQAVSAAMHSARFWYAPTLLWLGASNHALALLCWVGMVASLLLVLNLWPRAMLVVAFVCFLSFVSVGQDFSNYQSDGMLLEAGFLALFFAPLGWRPRLGRADPPSRASRFLLQWECFRIYFASGVVKLASHDFSWRHFTAMDDYYQNGPLPTWIGWYVQQFPHWFHASTVFLILAIELVLAWMFLLPRRFRIAYFCLVTPFQIAIILSANYTFLNYLVLSLGFLLLDDRLLEWVLPLWIQNLIAGRPAETAEAPEGTRALWRRRWAPVRMAVAGICLGMIFYSATAQLAWEVFPRLQSRWMEKPVGMLAPFRVANTYGLFAVMTHARFEIEFQGSLDGQTWTAYPFRYKPQDPRKAPGIYAPYQPRFEWNLWFASLESWPRHRFVIWTEERLLENEPSVLALFAGNPFAQTPPRRVRTVLYRYWFTDPTIKRAEGVWWRRELLGEYAPTLEIQPDGKIAILGLTTPPAPQR